MRDAPVKPDHCPRCGAESPCTDWCDVDIGVGVQTFDYRYTCPTHGTYAYETRCADDANVWTDSPKPIFESDAEDLADMHYGLAGLE